MVAPGGSSAPGFAARHSGAGVSPMRSGGTRPPPKLATSVKVCPRPPSFVTRTDSPAETFTYDGSLRHAGCPTTDSDNADARNAVNSAFVTAPFFRVQPPVAPHDGSFGSQSSSTAMYRFG